MDSREVADRFLETYVADLDRDHVRPLADYQAMFPGHEATIAREYRLLEDDELGDARTAPGTQGPAADPETHGTVGRYRIRTELGRGGQARVYLAHDPRLGRDVALKVLETSRFGVDVEARITRFRREAELAARLDHPGICGVLDVGEDEAAGVVFIAMRYIEGHTLAQLIAGAVGQHSDPRAVSLPSNAESDASGKPSEHRPAVRGKFEPESVRRVLEAMEKVARALHVAHEHGLVHRDVKPGNIMISDAGDPVVLDFGLARDQESEGLGLTVSSDVIGTPYYMSPEQVRGEHDRVDRRTDVYSLGVTLFECLTLRRPFEAGSREALYQQIVDEPLPDPTALNRNIPRDLKIVLETALEKDRERRYPTALAFADDLRRARSFEPITARALPVTLRVRRWMQRNTTVTASVGVLLVGLVVALSLLWTVLVRNAELERVRTAAVMRRVADSIEVGRRGEQAARQRLLETVEHPGFAWRWLQARNAKTPDDETPDHKGQPTTIPTGQVRSIAYLDEARLLAVRLPPGTRDARNQLVLGTLCVLGNAAGAWSEEAVEVDGRPVEAFTLALSRDRKRVAVGTASGVSLFDANRLTQVAVRGGMLGVQVTALCWSADGGRVAAAGKDGRFQVWRVDREPASDLVSFTPTLPPERPRYGARIRAVDFSPDGRRLLVAGDREQAWMVDAATGAVLHEVGFLSTQERDVLEIESETSRILAARFSPDGRHFVLAGRFARVTLYPVGGDGVPHDLDHHRADGQGFELFALDACFDPTGRFVVSSGADGLVKVHDVASRRRLGYFTRERPGWPFALAIDARGSRVAVTTTATAGGVSIFDLGDLQLPVELIGHDWSGIRQVVTTADGCVFSVDGRSVCKFELATGRLLFSIRDFLRQPVCIALRPGRDELAIGYRGGQCEVVHAGTGQRLSRGFRAPRELVWGSASGVTTRELQHAETGFYSLCYSPDGAWLMAGMGGNSGDLDRDRALPIMVLRADPEALGCVRQLDGHRMSVDNIRFFARGTRLVSAGKGGKLIVWDVTARDPGRWTRLSERPSPPSGGFKFTGDRAGRLVHLHGGGISVFDFATDTWLEPHPLAHDHVLDLEILPHGTEMLVTSTEHLTVWDVPPRNELLRLPLHHRTQSARAVGHYVPDGVCLAGEGFLAGGGSGSLYYQPVRPPGRELFVRRQTEWAAGTLVLERLRTESVDDVRSAIVADAGLPDEVRAAARRILDVTQDDGWSVRQAALTVFDPRAGVAAWRAARETLRQSTGTDVWSKAEGKWMLPMLLGVAHYRLGELEAAVESLKAAIAMPRDPYPDVMQHLYVTDFKSLPWCYLGLAQQKAGRATEAEASFARARQARAARGGRASSLFHLDENAEAEAGLDR